MAQVIWSLVPLGETRVEFLALALGPPSHGHTDIGGVNWWMGAVSTLLFVSISIPLLVYLPLK